MVALEIGIKSAGSLELHTSFEIDVSIESCLQMCADCESESRTAAVDVATIQNHTKKISGM
jgi:hypothetical protein